MLCCASAVAIAKARRIPRRRSVWRPQVRQVATGGMHTVAVLDNGTVYSWGVNDEGALGRQTEGPLWEKAEVRAVLTAQGSHASSVRCCGSRLMSSGALGS